MRVRKWYVTPLAVASIVAMTACESSSSADQTSSQSTTTSTTAGGGGDSGSAPESTPADTTPAPADEVSPETTPVADPTPTDADVDPTTGLTLGVRETAPPDAEPPEPNVGVATLTIEAGADSFSASGGTCTVYDNTVYVWVGELNSSNAVLEFGVDSGADSSLVWQIGSDRNGISGGSENELVVTLGEAATTETFGTFSGEYVFSDPTTAGRGPVTGSFSCTPAPFSISGDFPLSMQNLRCDVTGNAYSAGDASGDAVRLAVDPATITDDGLFEGTLSWRVGGQEFRSRWLSGRRSPDGTFGSFVAFASSTETGQEFIVSGGFSCNGGG